MSARRLLKLLEKNPHVSRETNRPYIGASVIGSQCLRQIWYEYFHPVKSSFTAQQLRTFQLGKLIEGLVIDLLTSCSVKLLLPTDENKGLEFFCDDVPLLRGHCDAIMIHPYHAIVEIKSAKDNEFLQFKKNGIKKWHPSYYAQCQCYMGMSGIDRCFFVVFNKDTSMIHIEEVFFDSDYYESLKIKASMILNAKIPPPRIHHSPVWWQCKMCKFNKICHK